MALEDKLLELRKSNGYTQEQLADKLGVTRQAISRWEQGETTPDVTTLKKLCRLYDVSSDDLIFGKTNEDTVLGLRDLLKDDSNFKRYLFIAICYGFGWIGAMNSLLSAVTFKQQFFSAIWVALASGLVVYYIRKARQEHNA